MTAANVPFLEARRLEKRWKGPIPALVNLAFTLAIFYATWWIFQDPRGYMRLYTPYVGYNYTRWILIVLIWVAYIFDFWPFKRGWMEKAHPVTKGIVLTLLSTGVLLLLIKGFFEGLLGNFAMAYFSPSHLTKLPGVTAFFAEEYAATACLMFAAIASWLSPSWIVAMEAAPWQDMKQPARGLSIWVMTFFLSTLVYFMTMHSHMGILYYPWQYFTAITPPYWEQFADTVSGNFHIAWIMCCTVVVWLVETIWERYPFSAIKNPWIRRLSLFFAIIAISLALNFFLYYAQELAWGEAIRGSRRDAAPDWRWLHVGETAIFFLVPALFLYIYCDNWPKKFSTPVNMLVRTVITVAGGLAIYALYYRYAHLFLGTQKGFSHPQQFPMIPMIWLINIWLINTWFMDNWPGWKLSMKTDAEIAAEHAAREAEHTWSPRMVPGLAVGAAAGVALYFLVVWAIPVVSNSVNLIPK
jgi:AAT family amino acid transporter